MVGKIYIDGKLCFYPLNVQPDPAAGIDKTTTDKLALVVSHTSEKLSLQSPAACKVDIADLNGCLVSRLTLSANTATPVMLGHGLFMATAYFSDGSKTTVKFVN